MPPVLKEADLQLKKDMLNIIGDVGAAVQTQKRAKSSKAKGAKKEPAPIDAKYASLGCELTPVAASSDEYKMVQTYTDNTQGYRQCKVAELFRVEDCSNAAAFTKSTKKIGNRKLLWHGTNVAVVAARPSLIPSLCTRFTRAGIEWRR